MKIASYTARRCAVCSEWRSRIGSVEIRNWKLEIGNWKLEIGNSKLETGHTELETGNWKLETQGRVQFPVSGFAFPSNPNAKVRDDGRKKKISLQSR
jgi:hypothetical protein